VTHYPNLEKAMRAIAPSWQVLNVEHEDELYSGDHVIRVLLSTRMSKPELQAARRPGDPIERLRIDALPPRRYTPTRLRRGRSSARIMLRVL
jgi:hypothetical protein